MIGDKIRVKDYHRMGAALIFDKIKEKNLKPAFSVSVAGESGSGKSEIAHCLKDLLENEGYKVIVLGQDDYFRLPPHSNHQRRKEGIDWVGSQEVRIDLLGEHVQQLVSGNNQVVKPLVYFEEDRIDNETVQGPYDVVIVEGTYTSLVKHISLRAFINRNYRETKKDRLARNRDQALENGQDQALTFLENVLEIEHKIIREHKAKADVVIPPPV